MNSFNEKYQYSEDNFRFIQRKIKQLAGINLPDTKTALVYSRISRLLRQHHLNSFDEYCAYLNQDDTDIENEFVNAITTNFTSFMREKHHFDYLETHIIPELLIRNQATQKMRLWSAGCSTGEEAYSINFIINEIMNQHHHWDIKILATDIDSEVLAKARQGLYPASEIESLPKSYLFKYFKLNDTDKKTYQIKDELKNNIYFKNFNLMSDEEWPMKGTFDVIFCRNVMIYFDRASQHQVIKSFINKLPINGYLILGHSESVPSSMQNQLKYVDKTIYRRVQ